MYLGVKMVIARSMERIHRANLINFGIIPADFVRPDDYDTLVSGQEISIGGVRSALEGNGNLVLKIKANGLAIPLKVNLTEREKEMVLAGGLINATKRNG
jgi:aconitate hydratase